MYSLRKTLFAAALLVAGITAQAQVSTNIGVTSDYIWRGVSQSGKSASVSGGIDYADERGYYAGAWVGSLAEEAGSELDLYFGYGSDQFELGYIWYRYPDNDDIEFGEIYGSFSYNALTAGLAYTVNNGSANDDAQFAEGDIYYYLSVGADISDKQSWAFTLGSYSYDNPAEDDSTLDDYLHGAVDFITHSDMGDFSFTLTSTNAEDDEVRAVVPWGISF